MMTRDQARELAIWIVATLILMLVSTVITVDKTPHGYYVESPGYGVWCVKGNCSYDADNVAFCSTDIDKVLQVQLALNRGK